MRKAWRVQQAEAEDDDTAILEWLSSRKRVAAFVFSENPYWLGYLGEALARTLAGGVTEADLYLWIRATPYTGLTGLHPNKLIKTAEDGFRALGASGGSRALSTQLAQISLGRLRIHERAQLASPLPRPLSAAISAARTGPLRDAQYRGAAAGWAVEGTLATVTCSSRAQEFTPVQDIHLMMKSYAAVFETATIELTRTRPEAVLIFNGRLLHEWAVREAATRLGLPIVVVEVGHTPELFSLHWQSAHDGNEYGRRVRHTWDTAAGLSQDQAHILAHAWFESRRTGGDGSNRFIRHQTLGTIPALANGRRRVVYYTSSSDELLSAGSEWLSPIGSQEDILDQLIRLADQETCLQIIVRMHPHTLLKNTRDQAWWREFMSNAARHNVLVLGPESPVDSYALADSADLVLSTGSTMGIEAAYWGRASATLAPAIYDSLGATKTVASMDEALDLRPDAGELAERRAKALPWGLYQATFGLEMRYFQPFPPTYPFGGRPLARRGRFQALVPEWVSRRRGDAEFAKRTGVRRASSIL